MKYFLIGGAGFIGSHFAQKLLKDLNCNVTIIDNEISGSKENLDRLGILENKKLDYIYSDILDVNSEMLDLEGSIVVNFAANPDISLSNEQPTLDFDRGTLLHNHVLELCRKKNVQQLIFTSGSGVYGDRADKFLNENLGNLNICSPYAANKLACEALSLAYSNMYGIEVRILRFGNVVGLNQTHGVAYDFIRRLIQNPNKLTVLGDGYQSKPYIHVNDVVSAIYLVSSLKGKNIIVNAASDDFINVRKIANIVINSLGLTQCEIEYGNTPFGWNGDVPVIRLDSTYLKSMGWNCELNSQQAIEKSVMEMVKRFKSEL